MRERCAGVRHGSGRENRREGVNGGIEEIRIGELTLGACPRIAVPLTDADMGKVAAAAAPLADLFELRIDSFHSKDRRAVRAVCRQAKTYGLPLLATVRSREEGGGADLSDARRLRLFDAVLSLVDAVDVEFDSPIRQQVVGLAGEAGKPVVVSYHDFARTPPVEDLVAILETARRAGADIVKLATMGTSMGDVDRLLGLLREHRTKHLIVVAMGEVGMMSRVFFPLLGSVITYAFAGKANAPGQLPLAAVVRELRRYSPAFRRARAKRGRRAGAE